MIKLSYEDTQYLMSYVQSEENSDYQVRLLCMFTNGFLTSDGFYKEVWADNRPSFEVTKPTLFNACSALDLPISFKEHPAVLSNKRADCINYLYNNDTGNATKINYIDMDRALELAHDIIAKCPDDAEYTHAFNVYNFEYAWCLLLPKK